MTIAKNRRVAALEAVFQRAASDANFRARCLDDAVAAFKESGALDASSQVELDALIAALPAGAAIRFVERNPDGSIPQNEARPEEVLIPLPPLGSDPDEITDERMLDAVAGGGSFLEDALMQLFTKGDFSGAYRTAKEGLTNWLNGK